MAVKHYKIKPKTLSISHLGWFFDLLEILQQLPKKIVIKYQKNIRITPSGYALLEVLKTEASLRKVQIQGLPKQTPTTPCHLKSFSMCWFNGALQPSFFEDFTELHEKELHEDLIFDLRLLFNELTQNAQDHSTSEKFLVLLTPKSIGVFDLGVSIPAKLAQNYPFENDVEALELSLKKGVTTRRIRPGGLGLYYTLELLKNNLGYLLLASRNGQIRRFQKSKKILRKKLDPKMPGTIIYCSLSERNLNK